MVIVGKKILRSLYLDPEADEALRQLSKKLDVPAAQLLREAVDALFDKYGQDVWSRKTATNPTRKAHDRTRKAKRPAKAK